MEQTAVPVAEQVREVVEAVVEVLREPKGEESSPLVAANSFEANALRQEIIHVGRKLWQRQYVDGNGGNISVRLGSKYVLCTPTMLSKGDLEPADICLSDLDGNILAGDRLRTSELLLHLEIYKANPRARAVLHCHPPYATAFAVTGTIPPNGLIPEYEVFIGPAAVAPYETPGTQAFAETILPFVEHHNTILLSNHGIVLVRHGDARRMAGRDSRHLLQDLPDRQTDRPAAQLHPGEQDPGDSGAEAAVGIPRRPHGLHER